jgi:hypothetical protein
MLELDEFVQEMTRSGVPADLAEFVWDRLLVYYTQSLRPHPSDRINTDLKIDPDDLSEIAIDYEKRFCRRFTKNPIDCPPNASICEFALSLKRGSVPTEDG